MVDLQLLEDLSSFVEVCYDGCSVVLQLKAVQQHWLCCFVALCDFGADVCLLEGLEVVIVSHAVGLQLFRVEGDLTQRTEVVQRTSRLARLNFEVLVSEKGQQPLILTDKLRVHEHIQHFLKFLLAVVEEGLIDTSKVRQIGLNALFERQFWQNEAFIPFIEVPHQVLKLSVSPIHRLLLVEHPILYDGIQVVLSEFVKSPDLHLLQASRPHLHQLGLWAFGKELLTIAYSSQIERSVLFDCVLLDHFEVLLLFVLLLLR